MDSNERERRIFLQLFYLLLLNFFLLIEFYNAFSAPKQKKEKQSIFTLWSTCKLNVILFRIFISQLVDSVCLCSLILFTLEVKFPNFILSKYFDVIKWRRVDKFAYYCSARLKKKKSSQNWG